MVYICDTVEVVIEQKFNVYNPIRATIIHFKNSLHAVSMYHL